MDVLLLPGKSLGSDQRSLLVVVRSGMSRRQEETEVELPEFASHCLMGNKRARWDTSCRSNQVKTSDVRYLQTGHRTWSLSQ